jgi:RNA polymerase sigma-70 factor (ECF subfamily)
MTDRLEGGRPTATSSSLLAGAQAKDQECWRRIVGLYAPLVLWWCRRRGLHDDDSQDVVQEVFKAVFARIRGFQKDGQPGAFRRMLFSIARNKIADLFRPREPAQPPVPEEGRPRALEGKMLPRGPQRVIVLHRALEQVRPRFQQHTWRAMWEVVVEARSPLDVAESLGMTVNAVYTAKSRVLHCIREEYEGLLP